jgi:hypothetical protein
VARTVAEEPLFTQLVDDASTFDVPAGAAYVAGITDEVRSQHVEQLRTRSPRATFVDLAENAAGTVTWQHGGQSGSARLRSQSELDEFWSQLGDGVMYLDITGLSHSVWAPLTAAAVRVGAHLRAVYVEPLKYRRNALPSGAELFDLSKGFGGLAPLPGFARLDDPDEDDFYFIPLLGFEGRRFSYLLGEVAPAGDHVIPIVGVPGFQPEFVGYAYDGNRIPLLDSDAWHRVKYATANCPFSLFYELEAIAAAHPSAVLKIAPIGTKPHGLGAVLFAIANPSAELLYDHPLRNPGRTEGAARLLVYDVDGLVQHRGIR